ncbi:MAG: glycosyl transferase family 51 [Frankiales bacterium]|nr:glycosyl transferase family 51 [Frankiales bacterium]
MPRNASTAARLTYALIVSVLAGLLLAAAAFPLVGSLGLTAKRGADEFLVLPEELESEDLNQRSRILAADGSTIALLYAENRVEAKLQEVPELARKAVIAIEDSRFYAHRGVDYKGTLRAAIENARAGSVSQGGSTLTQQYVKNALLQAASTKAGQQAATEQSLDRKLKEARYALAIERRMSKDEILEGYLNIAYYGNGVYGMGTAANFYFGKPVKDLTLAQGALLAGIVQTPGRFDPVKALKDPEVMQTLLTRRNLVLSRMRDLGYITEVQRAEASAEQSAPGRPLFTIRTVGSGCEAPGVKAPYFCDYIRNALERTPMGAALGATLEERQDRLLGGGLTIRTTLSPGVQSIAQRSAEEAVPPADDFGAGAVVDIVEPGTGYVKAMAVNRRYTEKDLPGHTKVNLAIGGSSGFQGGSTFKAFVLADAIRQGIPLGFTLYAPQQYTSKVFEKCVDCGPYEPQNAGDSESGTFDLVTATHDSVNTYFVQLEERLSADGKVESSAALAESMGVKQFAGGRPSAPLNRGGSFVLGGNEVSPLDMAAAYATFAARGLYCPPRPIVEITDARGGQIALPPQQCKQVLEQPVADTVNQVLSGVIDGDTRGRTGRAASIGRPAAGKTGTTNGSKAAWFIGYTPQLSTAVWVGYPGSGPQDPVKDMRRVRINGRYYPQVYGGTIPAPIWARTMRGALENVPERSFERPDRSATEGQDVVIPDVSGLPLDVAEKTLVEAGFSVRDGGRVRAAPIDSGLAAYTSPRAGRERPFGSTVTLYESNGRARQAVAPSVAPIVPLAPAPVQEQPVQPVQGPGNGKGPGKK